MQIVFLLSNFVLACLFVTPIYSQINVTFNQSTVRLKRDKNADKTYKEGITLKVFDFKGDAKISLKNANKGNATIDKDFEFKDTEFKVTNGVSELKTTFTVKSGDKKKAIDTAILVALYKNPEDKDKQIEDTILISNSFSEDEEIQPGKLTNYRVAIGHSFDFFDQQNNFISYGKVNVFLPNLVPEVRFGLDISLYQNRANFIDSSLRTGGRAAAINIDRIPGQVPVNDSLSFKTSFYNRKTTTTNNNYGLNINFLFTLTDPSSKAKNVGTDLYFFMNLEFIYRKINHQYDYMLTDSLTVRLPKEYPLRNSTFVKSTHEESFETYGGAGLMLRNSNSLAETTAKINFGYLISEDLQNPYFSEGYYYSLDVEFIENITGLNLTLGGQIRNYTSATKPIYNVYLSKTFTLDKLKNFLISK